MKHIYPAVFYNEGNGYSVIFPDFDCGTCGDTLEQAYVMAVDFLYGQLDILLNEKKVLPKPTEMTEIKFADDFEYISCFPTLVAVDPKEYKDFLSNKEKAVRKNVTIPFWLSARADAQHVNYSSILKEALIQHLR